MNTTTHTGPAESTGPVESSEPTKTDIIMDQAKYHTTVNETCGGKADAQTHVTSERLRVAAIIARLEAQIKILKSSLAELDVEAFFDTIREKEDK